MCVFLDKPNAKVLMFQVAHCVRCCKDVVPDDLLQDWVERLILAADIKDRNHWLKCYEKCKTIEASRAERLAIK